MAAERDNYLDRIVTNPKILVGKPVVKGTRIPVELVLAHWPRTLISMISMPPIRD